MKQSWTLHVEGFGKIEQADIRISPLMLFVGDNNSGKSYLMTLLWGILSKGDELFPNEKPSTTSYSFLEQWFKNHVAEDEFFVEEEVKIALLEWFNEVLSDRKEEFVYQVFNNKIPIHKLQIQDFHCNVPIKVVFHRNSRTFKSDLEDDPIRIFINRPMFDSERDVYWTLQTICLKFLFGEITFGFNEPIYLPASRTGFMLTYRTILSGTLERNFGAVKVMDNRLTMPVTRFLTHIATTELQKKSEYEDIATFLEKDILHGEIQQDESPVKGYFFKPEGLEENLSLHVTSSLVTELYPIILFLKSKAMFSSMIIEEPEAHLNLDMQRKMAQAIVRLVNLGLPVWITTHSDTLFQQINNLIKLHNHPNREQLSQDFGYEKEDFLDPKLATAYQFRVHGKKTEIEPLKLTKYGFAVPTFNQTIRDLTKESLAFQEMDTDDDAE